jgi:hypothetical protein
MAKVTYTEGRKPKGLNNIDKLAKVTNTGGENQRAQQDRQIGLGHKYRREKSKGAQQDRQND